MSAEPAAALSDAPLKSTLEIEPSGRTLLKRELDEPWKLEERARELFLAEIEAGVRIAASGEPSLVPLIAAEEEPQPWLKREFFLSGTLQDRMTWGPPIVVGEIVTAATGVLAGLDALQRLSLAHGDPSPCNVLITSGGSVRLADAASCRRRYAERPLTAEEERELDQIRFLRWVRARLAASLAAVPDRLTYRLLAELEAPEPRPEILAGLRHALREAQGAALPIAPPDRTRGRDLPPPAPLKVSLSLGPVSDPRACYLAAKALAEGPSQVAPWRQRLSVERVVVKRVFPQPARALAAELAGDGVEVDIAPLPISSEETETTRQKSLPPAPPVSPQPASGPGSSSPAPVASDEGTTPVPARSLVPLAGIPANVRRLFFLARLLFSPTAEQNVPTLAADLVVSALLVFGNLVLAHSLVLALLALTFAPGAGAAR